MKGGLCQWW